MDSVGRVTLVRAYHALVENCVYQPNGTSHADALRAIREIADYLEIPVMDAVADALEVLV